MAVTLRFDAEELENHLSPGGSEMPNEDTTDAHTLSGGKRKVTDGGDRLGEIFDAMTDRRRRYVLYYLQEEEIAEIETLAAHVTAWEQNISVETVSDDDYSSVQIDLFHNHLPKLQAAALVEYDRRSLTVRYRAPSGLFNEILRFAKKIERPQSH